MIRGYGNSWTSSSEPVATAPWQERKNARHVPSYRSSRGSGTGYVAAMRPFQSEQPPSGTDLRPGLPAMVCRANRSPTHATYPGPSGRTDGTLSRSPGPVADATPNAGQPLQSHTASRTPPIHVRSNEGRGRVPHALCKAQATSPDHESRRSRRVEGPVEIATRSGTDPDTGFPVSSTPDPQRSTRRLAGSIAAPA